MVICRIEFVQPFLVVMALVSVDVGAEAIFFGLRVIGYNKPTSRRMRIGVHDCSVAHKEKPVFSRVGECAG